MAMTIKGFDTLSIKLKNLSSTTVKEVKEILEFNGGQIEREAKANAPGSGDVIANDYGDNLKFDEVVKGRGWVSTHQAIGIRVEKGGLKVVVFVDKSAGDIAAWVEFGTGHSARSYLATVPQDWRDLARKFYVNGQGTILNSPYLLPAYYKYRKKTIDEIKSYLKTLSL